MVADVNDADFQADVLDADRPVVVDFWAPWCGPCRVVSPIIDDLAEQHGERVKFLKMNVDENLATQSRYKSSRSRRSSCSSGANRKRSSSAPAPRATTSRLGTLARQPPSLNALGGPSPTWQRPRKRVPAAEALGLDSRAFLDPPDDWEAARGRVVRRERSEELVVLAQRPERQVGDLLDARRARNRIDVEDELPPERSAIRAASEPMPSLRSTSACAIRARARPSPGEAEGGGGPERARRSPRARARGRNGRPRKRRAAP